MDSDTPRVETRWQAAQAGRVKYISKRPCTVCEGVLRYTSSGQCIPCTIERARVNGEQLRDALRDSKRK